MSLPDSASRYLETRLRDERRPCCLLIDRHYRLLEAWGELAAYGFQSLGPGDAVDGVAPYLVGLLGDDVERLPFVTMSNATVEVHVVPENEHYLLIVLDAGDAHARHRDRQQVANELRLLHRSQQQLIDRQRQLISELVEAKAELDFRRTEAEQATEAKSRFLAMMSHEFRTPLSSIINYAELALAGDASQEAMQKSAEAIARASKYMNELVDTVLDEARIEAGQVSLNERVFTLTNLLDDIATIMAPLAAEKELSFGVFLDGDVPERVFADDVCLRQVLINLLGNAIKFTDDGGVRLELAWRDNSLHARVVDTGPGIPQEDQARVFEAFDRGGELFRDARPGTGLGLSISLKLARLMRGDLCLSSEAGEGCQVLLTIPALVPDADGDEALPEPADEFNARRPATILLCDDDEDLLVLAEHYLQKAGYGLLVARDGEEAVHKAFAYTPDLVLLDINIPLLPGSAAARQLRAGGFTAPIVALTASDVKKLDKRDFSGSLRKPIQMPRLLAQLHSYL